MGLLTDIFFIRALRSDEELMQMLPAGDVYNNVADPDYDMENVQIPYIIVNNDGGNNQPGTKDDLCESVEDRTNISIRMVARNRDELSRIALRVRRTVSEFVKDGIMRLQSGETQDGDELCPQDYDFRFSDIANDMDKPAQYLMFYYDCYTINELFI